MDVSSWFQLWLDAPWYEKLFWLFMVGVPTFILISWIHILFEIIRVEPTPAGRGRRTASAGGIGFSDSYSPSLDATHDSSDSSVDIASSDMGSDSGGDYGGGGDFSGGGGDYGGGGSSGSWS